MTPLDCLREQLPCQAQLNDEELGAILRDLKRRADQRVALRPFEDKRSALLEAAEEAASELDAAADTERRAAALNAIVSATISREFKASGEPAHALLALLAGDADAPSRGRSIAARALAIEAKLLGGLVAELDRENLIPFVTRRVDYRPHETGVLDREIALELWEIGREDGEPGLTGIPEARQIAAIIDRYQEAVRRLQNRAGAKIRRAPGSILRFGHDPVRLRQEGFEAWRAFILPRLEGCTSFGIADPQKIMREAYDEIIAGVHLRTAGWATRASGERSELIVRAAGERMLQFVSADAWYAYHRWFGQGSLMDVVCVGLRHAARNTAIMQGLGTHPQTMFDRKLREIGVSDGPAERGGDTATRRELEGHLREVDGTTALPSARLATICHGWRAHAALAKLGAKVIGPITDMPVRAAKLRPRNRGLLDRYADEMRLISPDGPERRAATDLIRVAIDGMIGSVAARVTANDDVPGTASRLARLYLRLSQHQWWDEAHRTGVSLMLSRRLAQQKDADWDGLDEDTRRVLPQFEIGSPEWEIYRQHAVRAGPDGTEFILPGALRDVGDAALMQWAGEKVGASCQALRDGLETRLQAYYAGRGGALVLFPGARDLTRSALGTHPGTALGRVSRFLWQFKRFPSVMRRHKLGPTRSSGAGGDLWQLADLVIAMTILGYVALAGRELSEGRAPPDTVDPQTWKDAFVHGGAAGIYGDYIFDEVRRLGQDVSGRGYGADRERLSGLDRLYGRIRRGDGSWRQLLRFVKSETAILELLDSQSALDLLALLLIQDEVMPGSLRRAGRPPQHDIGQMRSW